MVILIVEADVLVGVALRLVLRVEGYRVRGPTGDLANALKLAAEEDPDLAFIDTHLDGGAGGIDLARALRDRHGTSCVFLTARPDAARAAPGAALGVVAKPYDPAVVLRTVAYVAAVRGGARLASVPRGLALLH